MLYSSLFIYSSTSLNERLSALPMPPAAICWHGPVWSTFLVDHWHQRWQILLCAWRLDLSSQVWGPRSLEQPLLFWSAVQWLISASEAPKHRGKGGGVAKRNVWLYFLDKINASGNSDGDMHPWEMFTVVAGINLPELLCWRVWWLGWLTLPWHKLAISPRPAGTLAMSPACFSPAPHTGEPQLSTAPARSTPPAKLPPLRSCFMHSFLKHCNASMDIFSTSMAYLKIFHYFLSSSQANILPSVKLFINNVILTTPLAQLSWHPKLC